MWSFRFPLTPLLRLYLTTLFVFQINKKCMATALLRNNLNTLAFLLPLAPNNSTDWFIPVEVCLNRQHRTHEASPCPVLVAFETIIFQDPTSNAVFYYEHRRTICAEENSIMHHSDFLCKDLPDPIQLALPVLRTKESAELWVVSSTCSALKKTSTVAAPATPEGC